MPKLNHNIKLLTKTFLQQKYVKENLSMESIANIVGCSAHSVWRMLCVHNISSKSRTVYRKYNTNIDFFKIWSHDLAYILGIIISDGTILRCKHRKTLSLRFKHQNKDRALLYYLKSKISPNSKVRINNKQQYYLAINDTQLCHLLIDKFKIIPNKTGREKIDFDIPEKYYPDLIRGLFDGDGNVKCSGNVISMYICSCSKQLLLKINLILNNLGSLNIDNRSHKKTKTNEIYKDMYYLSFTQNNAIKFRNFIYQNDKFCLKRKKNMAYTYNNEYRKNRYKKYSLKEKREIIKLYKKYKEKNIPRYLISEKIAQKMKRKATSIDIQISKLKKQEL